MYVLSGLPDSFVVGPYRFAVEVVSPLKSQSDMAWGMCDNCQHLITYQETWPCAGKAIDTVIHEILHALHYVHDIPSEKTDEETIVSMTGTALATFFLNNPGFVAWLNKALRAKRNEEAD